MLELTEEAGPDRLEWPECVQDRAVKDLGPLVLPAPTKREQVAALVFMMGGVWLQRWCAACFQSLGGGRCWSVPRIAERWCRVRTEEHCRRLAKFRCRL
ncbi:hypothetical protein [Kitasatospora sp. NPDC001132]